MTEHAPLSNDQMHGKRALILTVALALVLLLSVLFLVDALTNDPVGTYVHAYDVTADGTKESGKSTEYVLKKDGTALYRAAHATVTTGRWTKDGDKITVIFPQDTTVFSYSGDTLKEYHDGGISVYKKD